MKPSLRTDLMKNMSATLALAFLEALRLERAAYELKKPATLLVCKLSTPRMRWGSSLKLNSQLFKLASATTATEEAVEAMEAVVEVEVEAKATTLDLDNSSSSSSNNSSKQATITNADIVKK